MASYSDDFNRANATSLGANWTDVTGGFGLVTVSSNQALNGTGGTSQTFYASALATDNHYTQFTLITPSSACGITARHSGTTNTTITGYLANYQSPGLRLFKYVNGTFTQLGSTVTYTHVSGDVYKLTANGSSITLDVNGVNKITQTDTGVPSGKGAGMRMTNNTATADNWSAADLAAAVASLAPENRLVRRNSLLRR